MLRKLFFITSISMFLTGIAFAQGASTSTTTAATTSTSTTATAKPARFTPTKDQIMQGQKFLKDKKLYTGDATGVYNDPTRAAIRVYQKDNGLTVSGNFNQATLEKMSIALTDKQKGIAPTATSKVGILSPTDSTATSKAGKAGAVSPTDSTAKRPAPFRANVDQIKAAQKILRDGKMLTGGEDGKLDDATREGLGKYQDANGLKVTKTLNAATLEKMTIALTDAQKANVAAQAAYDAAAKKN